MSRRQLLIVEQPCVLCEETLQVWTLLRDDELGTEDWTFEDVEHRCTNLRKLMRERGRP